jgi:hypothetical protein
MAAAVLMLLLLFLSSVNMSAADVGGQRCCIGRDAAVGECGNTTDSHAIAVTFCSTDSFVADTADTLPTASRKASLTCSESILQESRAATTRIERAHQYMQ